MKKLVIFSAVAAGLVAVLVLGPMAVAGVGKVHVKANGGLGGYLEPPSISTTGTGTFEATIDDQAGTIDWTLSYADLDSPSPPLQAHVHFGQRSVNGGVSFFLCANPPIVPPAGTQACPAPPATISGTATAAEIIGPLGQGIEPGSFDEVVAAIRAGRTYANVHTVRFPGGEIRGQINDPDQRD
jgi:hypothetical protein